MKVSFNGIYLLSLQNKNIRDKVSKCYSKKLFNRLEHLTVDQMSCEPIVYSIGDKNLLILTQNDAKDYRVLNNLNKLDMHCYNVKKSPTINESLFETMLAHSYVQRANKLDFKDVSDVDILA